MSQATSPSRHRDEPDLLAQALEGLRQALSEDPGGRERDWLERMGNALAQVEPALRQHRALTRSQDGLVAKEDETRPTITRQADKLCSEHDLLLVQVRALRDSVRSAVEGLATELPSQKDGSRSLNLVALRKQADDVLSALEANRKAETDLVLESVNTDIGVGD